MYYMVVTKEDLDSNFSTINPEIKLFDTPLQAEQWAHTKATMLKETCIFKLKNIYELRPQKLTLVKKEYTNNNELLPVEEALIVTSKTSPNNIAGF